MRKLFAIIAAAIAAMPKLVFTICRQTGRLLLSLIPSSAPPTTSAGIEADDLLQEIRQSKEEDALFKMTTGKLVWAYAAAVISNGTPPDISGQSEIVRHWLEDLTPQACRQLLKRTEREIERHLAPVGVNDHLEGVPSVTGRPTNAPPVLYGSRKANEEGTAFVETFWSDLLSSLPDDEPARA